MLACIRSRAIPPSYSRTVNNDGNMGKYYRKMLDRVFENAYKSPRDSANHFVEHMVTFQEDICAVKWASTAIARD